MTKAQLIAQLDGLMDETDVLVWVQGQGEFDILRSAYQVLIDKPAFVYLIAQPANGSSVGELP
jgi:hypothetical protein